jgi:3-phenylpropionate/trans-cinnamate dioxygenase ferredoxin component
MSDFTKVASLSELQDGSIRTLELDGKKLAVARIGGAFHVIENTCCHRGGPLGEGTLADNIVTCPWHGWRFDVATGACLNNPAAKIARFETKVENDQLFVKL